MTHPPIPRILCVEDDQDVCEFISEMLKLAGYEAVTAQNLFEGLWLAKSTRFDLYLLDYHLPDGTGIELCKLIRALDTQTPILFYSSATEPELREAATAAGAQAYISKMAPLDILEQTISKLIESGGIKGPIATSPAGEVLTARLSQPDFDRLVERYNVDYRFLLLRASTGQYDCLLTSFLVLKDLYTTIIKLHEVSSLELRVIPYPISLRASEALLADFGFNQTEIERIDSFLKFIKETQGNEFEEILDQGLLIPCPRAQDPSQESVQ